MIWNIKIDMFQKGQRGGIHNRRSRVGSSGFERLSTGHGIAMEQERGPCWFGQRQESPTMWVGQGSCCCCCYVCWSKKNDTNDLLEWVFHPLQHQWNAISQIHYYTHSMSSPFYSQPIQFVVLFVRCSCTLFPETKNDVTLDHKDLGIVVDDSISPGTNKNVTLVKWSLSSPGKAKTSLQHCRFGILCSAVILPDENKCCCSFLSCNHLFTKINFQTGAFSPIFIASCLICFILSSLTH